MSDEDIWEAVDEYIEQRIVPLDEPLATSLAASAGAGLPEINVAANQGKLLHILAVAMRARMVLELGTLGGFSTIWLARAVPDGGKVVTLEVNPHHADVARANVARAGVADRVEVRVGPALETLPALADEGAGPFDLVFIDADKANIPQYVSLALQLTRPGSVIVVDNVVRGGAIVADEASDDPSVVGVRRLFDLLAEREELVATAIQTVGSKGHDGFVMAVVSG